MRLTLPLLLTFGIAIGGPAHGQGVPQIDDEPNNDKPFFALDTGGHTDAVYKLMVSEYTRQLVSVGLDKTIRLWDLDTGEPARVLRPPIANGAHGYLFSAALSPDGKLLAVGTYRALTPLHDHRIHLIDLASGQMVRSLQGHLYTIYDLAFSADGERLASASQDNTARIWSVATGETLHVLKGHEAAVHGIAWSPDGKQLVTGSLDKTARIWSSISGTATAIMREAQDQIMTVGWRPDGKVLATGCNDKTIRLYDTTGKLIFQWPRLPNEVTSLKFSADSKRLLYTCGSNLMPPLGSYILDMTTGKQLVQYDGHNNSPICCTFAGNGKLAVTGDSVSRIRVWDAASGMTKRQLDGRGQSMMAAGWSPDGQAIAWGTHSGDATIDVGNRLERTFCLSTLDFGPPPNNTFVRPKSKIGDLQMGLNLATTPVNLRKIYFLKNGALLNTFTLPQPYDQVRCYTLFPDDRAVIGSHDGAYLVNVATGVSERHMSDRGEQIWGVAPSPDWRYVLMAGNDQAMRIWRMDTGTMLVGLFVAGEEWIAWTPQGYYAASFAGERLMGWHINRGPETMSDFYAASHFHKSLYRPDVIRRLLAAGDLTKAIEQADRERNEQTQIIRLTDVLPAEVKITEPARSQVESADGKVTVQALAEARQNQPVVGMRLIINGRPQGPLAAGAEQRWDVELPPGKHSIVVMADTPKSFALSRGVEIARPAGENDPKPKLFLLAIGGSADAAAAASVAKALAAAAPKQFGQVESCMLQGSQATPEAIATELEKIRKGSTLADTTFVYVAGQESLDGSGQYQISTSQGNQQDSSRPGISGAELRRLLAPIQGRLMFAADTRRSQERFDREVAKGFCSESDMQDSRSRLDAAADEFFRELLTEDYGVVVLRTGGTAGSSSSGTSFSQAFGEGVSGKADEDADGVVYLHELSRYVNQRVRETSGGKQSTVIERPHGVSSFPIGERK
jgi:WD40 repeat protein